MSYGNALFPFTFGQKQTFVVYYADHLLAVATYQADMMQSSYQTLSITSVSQGQTVPYNILDDKINIFLCNNRAVIILLLLLLSLQYQRLVEDCHSSLHCWETHTSKLCTGIKISALKSLHLSDGTIDIQISCSKSFIFSHVLCGVYFKMGENHSSRWECRFVTPSPRMLYMNVLLKKPGAEPLSL